MNDDIAELNRLSHQKNTDRGSYCARGQHKLASETPSFYY